jgi:hypothetical protein
MKTVVNSPFRAFQGPLVSARYAGRRSNHHRSFCVDSETQEKYDENKKTNITSCIQQIGVVLLYSMRALTLRCHPDKKWPGIVKAFYLYALAGPRVGSYRHVAVFLGAYAHSLAGH